MFVWTAGMIEIQKDVGSLQKVIQQPLPPTPTSPPWAAMLSIVARGILCQFMSIDIFFLTRSQSGLFQRQRKAVPWPLPSLIGVGNLNTLMDASRRGASSWQSFMWLPQSLCGFLILVSTSINSFDYISIPQWCLRLPEVSLDRCFKSKLIPVSSWQWQWNVSG
jgi:hypothetical protein